MKTLITNIKGLLQVRETTTLKVAGVDMKHLPVLENAYLLIENDTIVDFGQMQDCPGQSGIEKVIDAAGRFVLPSWYDSHTHLVYEGNREQEFVDRIHGLSYEEIAQRGGGILNSAQKLQNATEESLYQQAVERLEEVIRQGTGGIEIKSGYGLSAEAELKMLRVIKRLKENYELPVKATFLGAHAVPSAFKGRKVAYVKHLIDEILPLVAQEKLADYIDVFCETGYFSVEDTEAILAAGQQYGLRSKIHVNQFTAIGGVQAGVVHRALSVDHLEEMREEDIEALKGSDTMPVALPGCSFFLSIPYTPARKIMDAGLPLALATDYNPGSTPSGNMNFVVATACIKMKMTPEEAINAATINGAYAIELSDRYGSICKGYKANLLITKPLHSYAFLPYAFGTCHIEKVLINGKIVSEKIIF